MVTLHLTVGAPELYPDPVSAVRVVREQHGAAIRAQQKQKSDWPDRAGVPVLITEMDGSMLPVVETAEPGAGEAPIDRRKTRPVGWKEARLALAISTGQQGSRAESSKASFEINKSEVQRH